VKQAVQKFILLGLNALLIFSMYRYDMSTKKSDSVFVPRLIDGSSCDGDSPESTRQKAAAVILGTVSIATVGQIHSPYIWFPNKSETFR
jgi:hypothetical protein